MGIMVLRRMVRIDCLPKMVIQMNEDEEAAWRLIEIRQKAQQTRLEDSAYDAVFAAQEFVEQTPSHELSIMTLRKAFELGFRKGRKNE